MAVSIFSIASFFSMGSLLMQLHLTRVNSPIVPFLVLSQKVWEFVQDWAVTGSA
jgi:hypothetical protein